MARWFIPIVPRITGNAFIPLHVNYCPTTKTTGHLKRGQARRPIVLFKFVSYSVFDETRMKHRVPPISPDMFNLARQVRAATDHAANAAGRLAGKELLKFADDETTIAQHDALREAAFKERRKIHDIVLEGIELALRKRKKRD